MSHETNGSVWGAENGAGERRATRAAGLPASLPRASVVVWLHVLFLLLCGCSVD